MKIDRIIMKSDQIEQMLLELNLRLVHSIALQHQGMGLELDDLVYEGQGARCPVFSSDSFSKCLTITISFSLYVALFLPFSLCKCMYSYLHLKLIFVLLANIRREGFEESLIEV